MASIYDTLVPSISFWLAIDEQLEPHKFRVISYSTVSERFYTSEYGTVSLRKENGSHILHVRTSDKNTIEVVYSREPPDEQEMLSLLIFWTAKPLFLAVPAPQEPEEQGNQETLF